MLFFLHIPKTGGQTLATRIAAAFPVGRARVMQADIRDPADLTVLRKTYDFVEGHPGTGVLEQQPEGIEVMAAVREPVEQIISHYRHILREPGLPLHEAALVMQPVEFLERFGSFLFSFQSYTLVRAFLKPNPVNLSRGEDAWALRHLETALDGLRWLVPTETIDRFCPVWSIETGRPLPLPAAQVNRAAADGVDQDALRRWLRDRPHRFAAESYLWSRACRWFEEWSSQVLAGWSRGPPGDGPMRTVRDEGCGVWLGEGWHPPVTRGDSVVEWWSGPGVYSRLRLRRGGRSRLRFQVPASLGVHMHRLRMLLTDSLRMLPITARVLPDSGIVEVEVKVDDLGEDEVLLLYGPEDLTVLPAVPLALAAPRRGFATQNWRLE